MTVYSWSNYVNTKFYGYSHQREDNTTMTEFVSGRKVGFQNNTRNIDKISCSLLLTKEEDLNFWNWFDNIGGCSGVWTCSDLGSQKYRFSEVPSPAESSQAYITLNMNIEEVY